MAFHIKSAIINEHRNDCGSIRNVEKGTWNSAWVLPKHEFVRSGILGHRGRSTAISCVVFRCNDSKCNATLAVETNLITDQLRKY